LDRRVVCHVRPEFDRGQSGSKLEIRRSHDDLARTLLPPERVEPRFEPRFVWRAPFFAEPRLPLLLACRPLVVAVLPPAPAPCWRPRRRWRPSARARRFCSI
jgi:hypothetical protein